MRVLFLHDAFPAQFGHVALELTRRHGWECHFLVEAVSNCPAPSPEMLGGSTSGATRSRTSTGSAAPTPWPQIYGQFLELCEAAFEAIRRRPDLKPDLVVAHGGRGAPTPLLRDVVDCPIINYCEYYFAFSHRDISYRVDLPPAEPAPHFPRCINAPVLVGLVDCDSGYSATALAAATRSPSGSSPRSRSTSTGSTTGSTGRARPLARSLGRSIPAGTRVVTFVSRGLESIRGFDLFMEVARPDRPRAARRPVRGRRQRGDLLRLGQAPHRPAQLQEVGAGAGRLRPLAVRLPRPGRARPGWPRSSGSATCTST